MIAIGVTGTDTGVGKTVVAAAICAALRARGLRVAPMKPVETGVVPEDPGDAGILLAAAGSALPLSAVSPARYREPAAPIVAAGPVPLDTALLDDAFARLKAGHDAVVVEGAGGLLVPLTGTERYDTLFARWGLELVVVTSNRLGAINHTLLTVEAAARTMQVRGVVLNAAAEDEGIAAATNAEVLTALLAPIPLRAWPRIPGPLTSETLARRALKQGFDVFWSP